MASQCETPCVEIQKLTSVDGFVMFDLNDAPAAGVARRARKVLRSSSTMLARSTTYSFACFDIRAGGAVAALNAEDDAKADEVPKFIDEIQPFVESGRLTLDPAVGFDDADLAPLMEVDTRPAGLLEDLTTLRVRGAISAARAVRPFEDSAVGVIGGSPETATATTILETMGCTMVDVQNVDSEVDVLFVAGKAGVIDHHRVADIRARLIVPLTPLAVTAKAYAELRRRSIEHVPDFVALAAPLLAGQGLNDPVERVAAMADDLLGDDRGVWWAAITRAEANLSRWQDELPFGRPLA